MESKKTGGSLAKPEITPKHISTEKLYEVWAPTYDTYPNVALRLEEQVMPELLGDVKGQKILDLGAGTGRWAIPLAEKGAKVTAVEPSPEMLKIMKSKAQKLDLKLRIIPTNAEEFESSEQFDCILLNFVLSYIDNPKPILAKAANLLSPDGQIIISENPPEFSKQHKYEFPILEEGYLVIHYRHTPEELAQAANKVGLQITDQRGLIVNESVREMFDQKPHKKFEEFVGTQRGIIYVLKRKTKPDK